MTNPNNIAPWERRWVYVNENRDLLYWREAPGVTALGIRQAITAVGVSVSAVKRYLNK
ncbi:DUF3606 domain-containing protein [Achromobacter kerstersii]|uniref:DUF3606 domain-containing protein n=1 Tax=Achromobacter kerstersii TaxID=1353890 RepID=UPI001583FB44